LLENVSKAASRIPVERKAADAANQLISNKLRGALIGGASACTSNAEEALPNAGESELRPGSLE